MQGTKEYRVAVILSEAKNPFIRGMRYFTAQCSVQYDKFASGVILNEVKNPFIRGMRYFTAQCSVQYDKFASGVILNEVKNLKKTQTVLQGVEAPTEAVITLTPTRSTEFLTLPVRKCSSSISS